MHPELRLLQRDSPRVPVVHPRWADCGLDLRDNTDGLCFGLGLLLLRLHERDLCQGRQTGNSLDARHQQMAGRETAHDRRES